LVTLQAEVAACVPAFPVLRAQLKETVAQAERAVTAVCGSFQNMVVRARDSVAHATASLAKSFATDERESSSGTLVTVMHRILERTETVSAMTLQTVQKMAQVEEGMGRISGSLHDVDEIARALRLLGFNATIEAARAGEHGRTFGVVAGETRRLAEAAGQISKSIQTIIGQLRKSVDDTSRELRTMSTALSTDSTTSRAEVNEAVGAMTATEAEMRRSVEQSARNGESLANDIARAVIAMQFQDSMSQQVTHVVDTLQEIEIGLTAHLGDCQVIGPAAAQSGRHDRARELMARYTMQSERDTHAAQLGTEPASSSPLGDNVELF
jgi:methyl-accepting chemotaxis protein